MLLHKFIKLNIQIKVNISHFSRFLQTVFRVDKISQFQDLFVFFKFLLSSAQIRSDFKIFFEKNLFCLGLKTFEFLFLTCSSPGWIRHCHLSWKEVSATPLKLFNLFRYIKALALLHEMESILCFEESYFSLWMRSLELRAQPESVENI